MKREHWVTGQPMRRFTWQRRIPYRLIGIILLAYILTTVDLGAVISALGGVSLPHLAFAGLSIFVLILARCWRWGVLVKLICSRLPLGFAIHSCLESIWLGLVTPGRIGEFRRALELAGATGRRIVVTGWLVTFDLALDLAAMLIFLLAGLPLLFLGEESAAAHILYGALLAVGTALFFVAPPIIRFVHDHIPGFKRLPGLTEFVTDIVHRLGYKRMAAFVLATTISFLGYSAGMWMLIAGMDLNLSPIAVLTMVGTVGVSGAIPITIFGLGTRELALIWFFEAFDQPAETAIAVSLMFLAAQAYGVALSFTASLVTKRFVRETDISDQIGDKS